LANVKGVPDDDRVWRMLLWTGGIAGVLLLGWQVGDYLSDAARPAMQRNDLASALASVLMLAVVGVIAARRAQLRKQSVAPAPLQAKRVKPKKATKRTAAAPRRKRRA
jgi:predicted lipid-binding transport protein (Tim44 family)